MRVKFLVDGMLGNVARFLRILGYDTEYYWGESDEVLILRAERENRVLLTKDRSLHLIAKKKGITSILVAGDEIQVLAEIARSLKLDFNITPSSSRCPLCNSQLEEVNKKRVIGRVPTKVFKRQDKFWMCPTCGKIYWIGSHWRGINKKIEEVKKLLKTFGFNT